MSRRKHFPGNRNRRHKAACEQEAAIFIGLAVAGCFLGPRPFAYYAAAFFCFAAWVCYSAGQKGWRMKSGSQFSQLMGREERQKMAEYDNIMKRKEREMPEIKYSVGFHAWDMDSDPDIMAWRKKWEGKTFKRLKPWEVEG